MTQSRFTLAWDDLRVEPVARTTGANGYVEIAVRTTDTGTPDLSVDHLNITLVQVGG